MMSRCWLHIGTGKTGTTSIQHYLARNRNALLAQDWLYPLSPGSGNHHALTAFALDDQKVDETRKRLGILDQDALARLRRELPAALAAEIAAKGGSSLILSNEVLGARLRTPSEVQRIKALCDALAEDTKVIVYLRNQVDYLVGRYTTSVESGNARDFDLAWARGADYAVMLGRWSAVFGRDNIVVRRYEKDDFPNGDIRKDFARALTIDTGKLADTRDLNNSLDAESIAFVRGFNRHVPAALANQAAALRSGIAAVLRRRRGGSKFVIPQDLASTIEVMFRASNAQVAADYFPSLPSPLFSPPSYAGEPRHAGLAPLLGISVMLVPLALYRAFVWLVRRGAHYLPL